MERIWFVIGRRMECRISGIRIYRVGRTAKKTLMKRRNRVIRYKIEKLKNRKRYKKMSYRHLPIRSILKRNYTWVSKIKEEIRMKGA